MAGTLPAHYVSCIYNAATDWAVIRVCDPDADLDGPLGHDGGMPVVAEVAVMFSTTRDKRRVYATDESRPIEVRVTVAEGLTSTALQRMPWGRYLGMADAQRRHDSIGGMRALMGMSPQTPKKRGPKIDLGFYEQVAKEYLEIRAKGVEAPDKAIANRRGANRNTVAGWIRRCRELELLPPGRPGRAG